MFSDSNLRTVEMNTDEKKCRICLEFEDGSENLLTLPCFCKGSLGYMHEKCFCSWAGYSIPTESLDEKDEEVKEIKCEICCQKIHFCYEMEEERVPCSQIPWKKCWLFIPITIISTIFICLSVIMLSRGFSQKSSEKIVAGCIFSFFSLLFLCGLARGIYDVCFISRTIQIKFIEKTPRQERRN